MADQDIDLKTLLVCPVGLADFFADPRLASQVLRRSKRRIGMWCREGSRSPFTGLGMRLPSGLA